MAQTLQKKCRAVLVWNWYSVSDSWPASSSRLPSYTSTMSAFFRRQIEQSQIVSSGEIGYDFKLNSATVATGSLVVSCGTQHSQSLVVVEPGGHVGRLHLSLSTCPPGSTTTKDCE